MSLIFVSLNQLQLYISFIMIGIYLPDSIFFYFTSFDYCTFNLKFLQSVEIPYWTAYKTDWLYLEDLPTDNKLHHELGYESRSFLKNTLAIFEGCIFMVVAHLIVLPILIIRPYAKSHKFLSALYDSLDSFFHF